MTGQDLTMSARLSSKILGITEATPEEAGPSPDSTAGSARSSVQRVNDLLSAFSDTAFTAEEELHSWESWNYSRLSIF